MKAEHGIYRQRIGKLLEDFICKKYSLFYNKKQRNYGYYDAYDKNSIYEIKGAIKTSNRFFIRTVNHKKLLDAGGIYIFVVYSLIDTDKYLRLITDISIENILFISAKKINETIINNKKEYFSKYANKFYYRISYNDISGD